MNDIKIIDAVERYIRGEMTADERLYFENLRKTSAEIDQLVVEHTLFLQQLGHFGERKEFKSSLNEIHTNLMEQGQIESTKLKGKAKVVYLWKRYKRVTAIAASIAGITAITISVLALVFSPKMPTSQFQAFERKLNEMEKKNKEQDKAINTSIADSKKPEKKITYTSGGTGFVIDGKGYLVTNYHVVDKARNIAVQNKKGEFIAKVVYTNKQKDIAILKITDEDFKAYTSVPYSISKNSANLAEPIFTLGYPKDEIVYGQGYLSSLTGYNGDTLSCQIEIAANYGNSGSPIMNKNGEVIGILNGRQTNTEGFTFAIHGKYIYSALDELKKNDTSYQKVKLVNKSSISGMERTDQVKKLEDYIFMVKVN